jgi:hypothetical protein
MTEPTAAEVLARDLSGIPEPLMLVDGRRLGAADGATYPVMQASGSRGRRTVPAPTPRRP